MMKVEFTSSCLFERVLRLQFNLRKHSMRQLFVHCADIHLDENADPAAPGGAVTLELCGSWDHSGPCRWPHETSAEWNGRSGQVRVVFVAEPADKNHVRALITQALVNGRCVGPDGKCSRWATTNPGVGLPSERDHAWGEKLGVAPGRE